MGTFTSLSYHIVFGTKFRRPTIHRDIRERVYDYIGGTIRGLDGHLVEIGGVEDHVHLLVKLPPTIALSNAVREIKSNSSKRLKEFSKSLRQFEWQIGFGAFTVSASQIQRVRLYLQTQEEHHKRKSFEQEYVEFLKRHGIDFQRDHLFDREIAG